MPEDSAISLKYLCISDRLRDICPKYQGHVIPYPVIFKAFRELGYNESKAKAILAELEEAGLIYRSYFGGIQCL